MQLKTYLESPYSLSADNQIQYFQITVLPTPLVVSASAMHLIFEGVYRRKISTSTERITGIFVSLLTLPFVL